MEIKKENNLNISSTINIVGLDVLALNLSISEKQLALKKKLVVKK